MTHRVLVRCSVAPVLSIATGPARASGLPARRSEPVLSASASPPAKCTGSGTHLMLTRCIIAPVCVIDQHLPAYWSAPRPSVPPERLDTGSDQRHRARWGSQPTWHDQEQSHSSYDTKIVSGGYLDASQKCPQVMLQSVWTPFGCPYFRILRRFFKEQL